MKFKRFFAEPLRHLLYTNMYMGRDGLKSGKSSQLDGDAFIVSASWVYCGNNVLCVVYFVQIRHASLERLLERLLDIRFLSVDFLNAFLITYRVFTSASVLLDTLLEFYYSNNAKQTDPLCTDLFPPVNRKVRSESLPTSSLSPLPDRKKGQC